MEGIGREWMYDYNIYYMKPRAGDGERFIDYIAKKPMELNRLDTSGTNIRRCVNNSRRGCGVFFPPELNHTIEDDDPATLMLFDLCYGHRRCDTPVNK